jgi:hypothetical protein
MQVQQGPVPPDGVEKLFNPGASTSGKTQELSGRKFDGHSQVRLFRPSLQFKALGDASWRSNLGPTTDDQEMIQKLFR